MITSLNKKRRTVVFKRTVVTALAVMVIVFALFSPAQSETTQKIEGLGVFKIGMTYDNFQAWLKGKNLVIGEVRGTEEYVRRSLSKTLVAFTPLPNEAEPSSSSEYTNYMPGHKMIRLNFHVVGDIKIHNIGLLFKNDILILIKAELSGRLEEALTAKYGDPVVDSKAKKIKCTYTYTGATQEKTEFTTVSTWRNDRIEASATALLFYDSKCELQSGGFLVIYNKSEYLDYSVLNKRAKKAYEAKLESEKKEELKKTLDNL